MIYAQILNSVIVNIIELDDPTLLPIFSEGFDFQCPEIDQLATIPDIGWFYDSVSTNFFPPATLALIQNNTITQIINNCDAYITNNSKNYQYIIDVTSMSPQPQVGWTYNGNTFIPSLAYYQALIAAASVFGNQLVNTFAATNVSLGITQAGMTGAVIAYTQSLYLAMSTGSLYQAITIIEEMIADTSSAKVGAYATATDTLDSPNIVFTANTLGVIGNKISLVFDGSSTVDTIVGNWNAANTSNPVSYTGSASVIPAAQTINLSGGINSLSPFITNAVLTSYLNQIENWLESP